MECVYVLVESLMAAQAEFEVQTAGSRAMAERRSWEALSDAITRFLVSPGSVRMTPEELLVLEDMAQRLLRKAAQVRTTE